jgi:hydroxyethylthiazole kinase
MRVSATDTHVDVLSTASELLDRLRTRGPGVHCITNTVAQNFTTNVLLAMGCVPSMTLSNEEIGDFVSRSDALLVNLGTFDRERREATMTALDAASQRKLPWVLDPVLVDRSPLRANFARDLIKRGPSVIRLNLAEFAALAETEISPDAAKIYARDHGIVLGLSGETDLVTDGRRTISIANGHSFMAKVTAMGCAGSALVAACLAVEKDAWLATVAAMLILGIAGERAAVNAAGPGSFAVAIIDALYSLDQTTIRQMARIS